MRQNSKPIDHERGRKQAVGMGAIAKRIKSRRFVGKPTELRRALARTHPSAKHKDACPGAAKRVMKKYALIWVCNLASYQGALVDGACFAQESIRLMGVGRQ
jgi:hypothetical protein